MMEATLKHRCNEKQDIHVTILSHNFIWAPQTGGGRTVCNKMNLSNQRKEYNVNNFCDTNISRAELAERETNNV